MATCERCGRGPMFGHNVSHSMVHTKRQFKLNIQRKLIYENGKWQRRYLCSRCLKTMRKTA